MAYFLWEKNSPEIKLSFISQEIIYETKVSSFSIRGMNFEPSQFLSASLLMETIYRPCKLDVFWPNRGKEMPLDMSLDHKRSYFLHETLGIIRSFWSKANPCLHSPLISRVSSRELSYDFLAFYFLACVFKKLKKFCTILGYIYVCPFHCRLVTGFSSNIHRNTKEF